MAKRLDGKVAIVFGAGSVGPGWGSGKATAVQFAREGATIIAVDLKREAALETGGIITDEGPGEAAAFAADVTGSEQIRKIVDAVVAKHGRIDILHNNVGLPKMGGPVELSEADWDFVMDVSLKSIFLTCKHVLPHMAARRKGAIVNISSIAAIRYTGYSYSAYYAAKGGVNQLTVGLALQYAAQNIRVNATCRDYEHAPYPAEHHVPVCRCRVDDPGAGPVMPDGRHGHRLGRGQGGHVPGVRQRAIHHRRVRARRRGGPAGCA